MPTEDVRRLLADGAAGPSRPIEVGVILRQGRRLQRARVVSMTVLSVAAVLVVAITAANLDSIVRPEQRNTEPNRGAAIPEGWTELPLPPQVRDEVSLVWAGSELLAWGGCDPTVEDRCQPTAGGFGFNPETRSWRPLENAPAAGANAVVVWTGEEAIFLLDGGELLNGQAYDPVTETWRTIAAASIPPRAGAVAVWTGSEVIYWGGGHPEDSTAAVGAAYDPTANTWRRVADAPVGLNLASGMWTGREMIVFGSLLDERNIAATRKAVGAAYDPSTDVWRKLPPSELWPQATSAVWAGGRVVAWDHDVRSQEYDEDSNAWSPSIKMPLDFSECYPDSAVASDLVFAFYCGRAALYDTGSGAWTEIHGGPLDEEIESGSGYALKLWRFGELASTGDTVFFLAEGITIGRTGEACYGCSGSPVSFWGYRPPA